MFTGCEGAGRNALEVRSAELGVRVLNSVSSKTALLVTDHSVLGGKHEKATALGVRMVDPDTYRELLAHLQPAVAPSRPVAPRGASSKAPAQPAVNASTRMAPAGSADASATPAGPSPALVRAWGRDNGWEVGQRGRLPAGLMDAYVAAHPD